MTDKTRFSTQRARTLLGLAVVTATVLVAAALAGFGFAKGSPTAPSAAANQYGKVTICHHTKSKKHPWVTITISKSAWLAQWHKTHPDDTLGPCPASKTKHKGKAKGHSKAQPHHSGTNPGHGK